MNLSQDQLDKITEYASALTPIGDIAVLMGLDEDEIFEEFHLKDSPIRLAYHRGRAQTEYDIRSAEINMAVNGSPMAIQQVRTYIESLTLLNDQ